MNISAKRVQKKNPLPSDVRERTKQKDLAQQSKTANCDDSFAFRIHSMELPARLHGLTLLRFGAALWVVLFHAQSRIKLSLPPWLDYFFGNGTHAMSLFFILSGVVLVHGYHGLKGTEAIKGFYLARFARLYPVYALLQVIALFWFTPAVTGWPMWIHTNVLALLGLQAWFPPAFSQSIFGGTWTISVEFFFYALFPALLPTLIWLRQRIGTATLCFAMMALSGFIGWTDYVYNRGTFICYILPAARLPEFCLGMVLGLALLEPARLPRSSQVLSLLLAGGAVLWVVCTDTLKLGGLWVRGYGIIIPLLAWLLFSMVRTEQSFRPAWRTLPSRLFIYLGESSYCLFLGHLILLRELDSPSGLARTAKLAQQNLKYELMIVVVVSSLVVAVLLHAFVEKPARRALLKAGPRNLYGATLMPLRK